LQQALERKGEEKRRGGLSNIIKSIYLRKRGRGGWRKWGDWRNREGEKG